MGVLATVEYFRRLEKACKLVSKAKNKKIGKVKPIAKAIAKKTKLSKRLIRSMFKTPNLFGI